MILSACQFFHAVKKIPNTATLQKGETQILGKGLSPKSKSRAKAFAKTAFLQKTHSFTRQPLQHDQSSKACFSWNAVMKKVITKRSCSKLQGSCCKKALTIEEPVKATIHGGKHSSLLEDFYYKGNFSALEKSKEKNLRRKTSNF